MRNLRNLGGRVRIVEMGKDGGAFIVSSPIDQAKLLVIASTGMCWDHVSVSRKNRVPNWAEMEHVHKIFFEPDETAVQYHVPATEHVNMHEFCLHMWRCQDQDMPRPPSIMIGVGDRVAKDLPDALRMVKEAGL